MTKSLSDYISTSYAEHPDTYQDDFRVLDELRADIVNLEPHQNALNRLLKYVLPVMATSVVSRVCTSANLDDFACLLQVPRPVGFHWFQVSH